ncbi:GTPase HflX [Parasphaerochaeta coccoides]|uniref:GTPase HflX n=1 Tax=Parasphaerochaeta coccoides (strain ATCC BAA-1237 / DSM 17374 / SPN1) TaxID=760011 RepID=F4GKC4_PARC1|nr:GTPase HflX [Parasphaerochaeta coccoides]AEC02320.1 GTP-binding proten HflX [Parasphaerochaeta coccoides DSM 17374]
MEKRDADEKQPLAFLLDGSISYTSMRGNNPGQRMPCTKKRLDDQDFFPSHDSRLHDTEEDSLSVFLVGLRTPDESVPRAQLRLQELDSLVRTAGMEPLGARILPLRTGRAATLIGSGQALEIKELAEYHAADAIVFDRDIPPRAQRNLEDIIGLPIHDRQGIIITIFGQRASTKEAVLQVELARLHYVLPRLTGSREDLSRQQGGVKGTRGGGEAQLELDRRRISDRIACLKTELTAVRTRRERQRTQRKSGEIPVGAIVGYTNSGKSSLLKALSGADILVEDKLFATLDPTTRRIRLPESGEVLLSDTVGFVSDLPHHLVDAFRSTLEEATDADFLVIVCDASHPDMLSCYQATLDVLHNMGADGKPTVTMLNKMDVPFEDFAVAKLRDMIPDLVETSIKKRQGLNALLEAMAKAAYASCPLRSFLIPADRHDLVSRTRQSGRIETLEYTDDGILLSARLIPVMLGDFLPFQQ